MQGEMSDIIARLEAASEGSRELDADVLEALGFEVKRHAAPRRSRRPGISWRVLDGSRWVYLPRVTTDIGDALTLVPEGWSVHLHSIPWRGLIYADTSNGDDRAPSAQAKTLPLALCIAALKARAPAPGSAAP